MQLDVALFRVSIFWWCLFLLTDWKKVNATIYIYIYRRTLLYLRFDIYAKDIHSIREFSIAVLIYYIAQKHISQKKRTHALAKVAWGLFDTVVYKKYVLTCYKRETPVFLASFSFPPVTLSSSLSNFTLAACLSFFPPPLPLFIRRLRTTYEA